MFINNIVIHKEIYFSTLKTKLKNNKHINRHKEY